MVECAFFLTFFFSVLALQSVVFHHLSFDFLKFDSVLPFLVYLTFFRNLGLAFFYTLVFSLIQEGFSICPPGLFVFTKTFVFLMCILLKERFFIESKYTFGIVCAGFYIVETLIILVLSLFKLESASGIVCFLLYLVPNAALTGLFSIVLYPLLFRFRETERGTQWT